MTTQLATRVFFSELGWRHKLHIFLRLQSCPFHRLLPYLPPSGRVLDFGCGHGHFTAMMASESNVDILAVEHDEAKIKVAERCLSSLGPRVQFRLGGDLPEGAGAFDAVTLIDVLYLFPLERWKPFLVRCRQTLNRGGVLLLKEMEHRPRWKFLKMRLQEVLAVKLFGWTKGENTCYPSRSEISAILEDAGFRFEREHLHSGYSSPHILYICRVNDVD